jgi:hypothetical protein
MNFSKAELISITITSVQAFFLIDFSTTDLVPCPLNIWVFEFIGKNQGSLIEFDSKNVRCFGLLER